ncbi:hypothetical protein TcCL_Unassigned01299, partial [Trypanosoma cruzi]
MSVAKYSHKHQNTNPHSALRDHPQRACVRSKTSHHFTASALCLVCMCLYVWQRRYLQSSCAPQESQKKATAERQIAHTQITHIITHTRSPRNGCSQPQNNEKQNKKPKRGTTSAHTLIAPVKQNTHTGRERERGPPTTMTN